MFMVLIEMVLLSTHNMFWLSDKKNNFGIHTLIWRPDSVGLQIKFCVTCNWVFYSTPFQRLGFSEF